MENSLEINEKKKKKNSCKFCTEMPLGSSGQEFLSECNVTVFAQKILDSIYRGPENI